MSTEGERGEKGDRGSPGDTGETGATGAVGESGATGERGLQGVGYEPELIAALKGFIESRHDLAHVVDVMASESAQARSDEEDRRKRRRGWVMAGCIMVGLLFAVNFALLGIVIKDGGNRSVVLERIDDCTLPAKSKDESHKCYEDGQARQGEAVSEIVMSNLRGLQCLADGVPDIAACVAQKHAAADAQKTKEG